MVASSCASMGLDARNVRAVVNVGMPSSDWILKQQAGRAGRDGKPAVSVNLARRVRLPKRTQEPGNVTHNHISLIRKLFPPENGQAAAPLPKAPSPSSGMSTQMKAIYAGQTCIRKGLNNLFTVRNPYRMCKTLGTVTHSPILGVYTVPAAERVCSEDCKQEKQCNCSSCICCSVCSEACSCPWSLVDPDEKLAEILGLASGDYRFNCNTNLNNSNALIWCSIVKAISSAYTSMEDEEDDSYNTSDEDEDEEEDEVEQQPDVPEDYRGDNNPDQDWVWEPANLEKELD